MLEVFLLAVALSMDAFTISIGLGAKQKKDSKKLALMAAGYFGLFQALMPLIGYWAGKGVLGWVAAYAPWVAFTLLATLGAKMIYESLRAGIEDELKHITHQVMLVLTVATSIDAMAAGFVLNLLSVNALIACLVIGITTCVLSYIGVFVGEKSGTQLENKAELLGGIILILIGLKMLFV